MRRVLSLSALLLLASCAFLTTGTAGAAAQPALQPLDLPCADGVSAQPLGQAVPSGAEDQALAMLRVVIEPSGSLDWHTHPGTLIVSIESGAFGFTMADDQMGGMPGEMQVMRAATDGTPAAVEPVQPGAELVLHPGDWVVESPGMVHRARNAGDDLLSVLVTGLVAPDQPFIQCLDVAAAS